MPVKWIEGRVFEIEQLTNTTKQFKVKIESEEKFTFIPGQFVTMDLPVSEKRLHRWRSYSIANHPDDTNVLEFCIVQSEDGLGTQYLFEEIIVGSVLKFKGPDGGFVLPTDLQKEIVLICTGTGVAPFRSMLQHIVTNKLAFKKIVLIFGTRFTDGILYKSEFDKIASDYKNFFYHVALSREIKEGCHHGYVHDVYSKLELDPDKSTQFYICGWTQMIDEAVSNIILKMGYDKSNVHYELYG